MSDSHMSIDRMQAEIDCLQAEVERLRQAQSSPTELSADSDDVLSRLTELVPAGIAIYQNDRIVYANRAAYEMIGLEPSDANRERLMDFMTPEDREVVRERSKARYRGDPDVPSAYEVRVRTAEDKLRWLLARAALIRYAGAPATLAVSVDITERREMLEALSVSQANLKAILESTNDYVLLSDGNAKPVYFNSAYAAIMKEMLGIEMRPGLQPHSLLPDPKMRKIWDDLHVRVLSGEQFTADFAYPGHDGQMRYFEHTFYPVRDGDGVVGFCEFTKETTERRRQEDKLQRFQQEQTHQLQRVAGGLAHEIYNAVFPASVAILKLQERLSKAEQDNANHLRTLDLAQRSLSRTIDLTESVRLFSRLDRLDIDEPTDFAAVVAEVLEQRRDQLEEQGIAVNVAIAPGLFILCPRTHLYSLVENLVANGARALREASQREIQIHGEHGNGVGVIYISDTGGGISKDHLDHIFEPFFTTSPGVGSGLGLAIVKRVVDLCGGSIAVESAPGEGTSFDIHLPGLISSDV